MELEVEMSSLIITKNKRRLSGIVKRTGTQASSQKLDDSEGNDEYAPKTKIALTTPLEDGPNSPESLRRSSRKRSVCLPFIIIPSEPATLPPQRQLNLDEDLEEIKKIYLDKSLKRSNPTLETIFEVPLNKKIMSGRKFRRTLLFDQNSTHNRLKTKKRLMKAEKVTKTITKKKITMNLFMQKLAKVESEND